MMGRKAAWNMQIRNTNKIGSQCVCWFHLLGILPQFRGKKSETMLLAFWYSKRMRYKRKLHRNWLRYACRMHQIQSVFPVNCQSSGRWRNILAAWIRHDFMSAYSLCLLIAVSFGFLNPGHLPTTNDGCSTAAPVRLYSCSPHPHGRKICNDFLFCLTWIKVKSTSSS
jgi:hypothetical protein